MKRMIDMFKKTSNRKLLTVLVFATALALIGCGDDDDNGIVSPQPQTGMSFVRVGHLSPDAGSVDVWVDGAVVLEDVGYSVFSSYLELDPGKEIRWTPGRQLLLHEDLICIQPQFPHPFRLILDGRDLFHNFSRNAFDPLTHTRPC